MPRPNAGCQTCKIRRIKCDETQPVCQKCTKSRRVCLDTSVAKQACFSIHIENPYASGKAKRPRGPRSSLTTLRPHLDLPTRALSYYLQCHLQDLSDIPRNCGGLSECISSWHISGRSCPMVDLALSSLSLAVYAKTQMNQSAATAASSRYCRLLHVAQEQIAQLATSALDSRRIDACLLAVSLMGRYEGAIHCPADLTSKDSFLSLQSWFHHDGAMAILKVWHDNMSTDSATYIMKQTRRALIKSCLLRNLPLPPWLLDGRRFGENDIELHFNGIVVRIVNLRHALACHQRKKSLSTATAEELNNEAKVLDAALQDWADQIPGACSPKQRILPASTSFPRRHFYSSTVYSYPKPGYAASWSNYFAVRMLINHAHLRILELADLPHHQQRLKCTTHINAMADNIASSVPFCLERFTVDPSTHPPSITLNPNSEIKPYLASLAVWPLTITSCLDGTNIHQQRWSRAELAGLGRITGDGILECAETDGWAVL